MKLALNMSYVDGYMRVQTARTFIQRRCAKESKACDVNAASTQHKYRHNPAICDPCVHVARLGRNRVHVKTAS